MENNKDLLGAGLSIGGQALTFLLDDSMYALSISTVREIVDVSTITTIPRTPDFLRGVLNLRGEAVPVLDLRRRFGLQDCSLSPDHCVIISELNTDGHKVTIGTLVDAVREVVQLAEDDIKPPPAIGMPLDTECIRGIVRMNGDFVSLLDFEKICAASGVVNAIKRVQQTKHDMEEAEAEEK
ncbi:chemotaxis protein CheW [Oleidesulfovibrio sp.]|uniref:chemotaxis protein CheW n=1 Tax=Oleidesulfovibrio sp. TaxID=2909707 RepID=UPI003A85AF14